MGKKDDKYRELFENLDKKSGDELKEALEVVLNTFSPENKIQREFYLDRLSYGVSAAVETGLTDLDKKTKIIDFIKTSCERHDRLDNQIRCIALDKNEIMKLRWHACDALEQIDPEQYEIYMSKFVLRNRDSDPEKVELDMDEARKQLNEQEKKNFKWWVLSPFLIFGSMAALYVSWNKPFFIPIAAGICVTIVFLLFFFLLRIRRCPSCKRFFAREKLVLRATTQSTSFVARGSQMVTNYTVKFYSAHCKYCKHEWLVKR